MTVSDADVQQRPPVGTPVRFTDADGVDTVGIITSHSRAFPAAVGVSTDRPGYVALCLPHTLRPALPADDLQVHWLQAHIMLTAHPPYEQRTP